MLFMIVMISLATVALPLATVPILLEKKGKRGNTLPMKDRTGMILLAVRLIILLFLLFSFLFFFKLPPFLEFLPRSSLPPNLRFNFMTPATPQATSLSQSFVSFADTLTIAFFAKTLSAFFLASKMSRFLE